MKRDDDKCDSKSICEERATVTNTKRCVERETTTIKTASNYNNGNNNINTNDGDDFLRVEKNCTPKNVRNQCKNDVEKNSENENDFDKLSSMTSPTSVRTTTTTTTTKITATATESFRRPSSLKLFPNLPSIDNCDNNLFEHGLFSSCSGKQEKKTTNPSSTTNFGSVASSSSPLHCFASSSGSSITVAAADTATNEASRVTNQYNNESTLSSTTYSEPETPPDRGGAVTFNSGLTLPYGVNSATASAFTVFQQQHQQHQQIYPHHSQQLIPSHLFASSYTNPYTFQQFNMLCAPWKLPATTITAPPVDTTIGRENCDSLTAATLATNEPAKRTIATGELGLPSLLASATTPIYCAAQQPSIASQQQLGENPDSVGTSNHLFDDHNQNTASGFPNFGGFLFFPDAPVVQNPFSHQLVTRPDAGSNSPERQPLLLQPLSRLCAEASSPTRANRKAKGGEETNEESREALYYHQFTAAESSHHSSQFHFQNQPPFESSSPPNATGDLLPFTTGVATSSPEEYFAEATRNIMTRSSGSGAAFSANHQISGYATAPEPTTGRGRGNRRGGRKPREMEQHDLSQLSKVEMDKRAKRRERNKLAAARCRKRRLDLMQMLQNEVDQLRDENQHYKMTIEQLFRQKEQLVRELVGHPNCLLPKNSAVAALKSAGVAEPAQFEQLVSQQQHHFMLHHPQSSSSSSSASSAHVVYTAAGPPMDGASALLMVPQTLADGRLSTSPSLMQQYPPAMMPPMSNIAVTAASSVMAISSAQRSPLPISAYDDSSNGSGRSSRHQFKMGEEEEEDDDEDDDDDEEDEEDEDDDQLSQLRRREVLAVNDNDLFKAELAVTESSNESVNDADLTDEAEDKQRHMLMTDDDPVMSEAVLSADATLMKRPRPVDRQAAVGGGRKRGGQNVPPQATNGNHHNQHHHHEQLEHQQPEQHQEQQHRPTTLPLYPSTTTTATTCGGGGDTAAGIGIASVQITTPSTGLLCQHDGYDFNLQNQRTYFTPMSGELKQL